jgi:hypothetical protein
VVGFAGQALQPTGLAGILPAGIALAATVLVLERALAILAIRGRKAKMAIPGSFWVGSAAGILLVAFAFARELHGWWTTFGWSITGLVLVVLGFAWKDRAYRRIGLAVLGLSLVRAVVDISKLELAYRTVGFISLGACLLAVSYLYSRFRAEVKKLF